MNDELKLKLLQGVEVFDERGRKIKVKKPSFLAELKLTEALGKSSDNERYFNMLAPILWVAEIDEIIFTIGTTKREVEAAYERLGQEGMNAFYEAYLSLVGGESTEEEKVKKESEEINSIKK